MDTMMSRLATSEGSLNFNNPTPSRQVNLYTISSRFEILEMVSRQKCKKCGRGGLEPAFNGDEYRYFLCGWSAMDQVTARISQVIFNTLMS